MANKILYTDVFEKYYKRYAKKFRSLPDEIAELEQMLLADPKLAGIDEALDDVKHGRVTKAKSAADLLKQCL